MNTKRDVLRTGLTRRDFLKASAASVAAGVAAPYVLTSTALGGSGRRYQLICFLARQSASRNRE